MTSTPPAPHGGYQSEIYAAGLRGVVPAAAGLGGVVPALPMAYPELEARAAQALPPSVVSYVAGGARILRRVTVPSD